MNYVSLFSGIEAASVAWNPLGWRALAFSEIEPFPCAVLAHHYPDVPNHGDVTGFDWSAYRGATIVIGGSPCQAFSVAGLRRGLDDPRGNLTLAYLAAVEQIRPAWMVWENVPGVLSIDAGRVFGAFLGALGKLGYGFAYRVLDAQHFGVPQRRRRVFVVGHLGDWRRAAAVLFERESLSGHPAPGREAGEVAPTLPGRSTAGGGLGTDFDCDGGCVTHSLRADGFDASEDGTGRGTPLVPMAFSCKDHAADASPIAPSLRAMGHDASHANAGGQVAVAFQSKASASNSMNPSDIAPAMDVGKSDGIAVALNLRGRDGGAMPEIDDKASVRAASGGSSRSYVYQDSQYGIGQYETAGAMRSGRIPEHQMVLQSAVRRLTPKECARLQGFPDDYLDITYRGKPAADGPKYKALGNSFAVPVISWIGERIAKVSDVEG